ncbi:helix-turn-helix transcriptional regulator [Streptomyces sp. PSKA54]|uniref:Helix-turn-helix transcriptional regulator n=1 Tax=Streptomyces himalayensis subsp. aureolus TaxID=2758039 RepID=A0A7W2CXX5_9ACTN|nr:helix-turn-helix domain-containing protein [Streptomyces himalayensis]MBA4861162.1 helix-turn-helix transcriptional regulator [Streptomyces himalayensis subsp. aureolus]
MNHTRWKLAREREVAEGYVEPPEVVAEREQIRLAHDLGQLVYDRRTALGLTQAGLGERLGMTADEVEAVELGGMLPVTADLLVRLAAALQVTVNLHVVSEGHNTVVFGERAA